tara:strand:+ start:537 stop:710 length:174 start_codon:yes stop_codon:yes gene_type:complete
MKQSRLTLTIGFGIIISTLCAWAIYKDMDGVSTILAGALGGIVAKYTHDETKRSSKA